MFPIHRDNASKISQGGEHPGDARRQILVNDPQSHFRFEQAAQMNYRLITKTQSLSFLNGFVFGQADDVASVTGWDASAPQSGLTCVIGYSGE